MSPWRRALAALIRVAVLIAFLGVLISLLGDPISIFFMKKTEMRRRPATSVVLVPLTDYSVANSPGTTLSYFGYMFDVPWSTSFKEKAFSKGGLVQLQFASDQNITLIVPENQAGFLREIAEDPSLKMGKLRLAFPDLMKRSPYDQYGAVLNTTPDSIRPFGPRAEAFRGLALLTIKAISLGPGLESGAFSFELSGKRGFQIGDPQKSGRVDIEVFDSRLRHVDILCGTASADVRLSQSELNRIIASLHSTTASSPKS